MESRPTMRCCRMLGVVNGRADFETVRSVGWTESALPETRRLCVREPACVSAAETAGVVVDGGGVNEASHAACCLEWHLARCSAEVGTPPGLGGGALDAAALCALDAPAVEALLGRLLEHEEQLRLSAAVQAVYSAVGETEAGLSLFTAALQRHVAAAAGFSPPELGVQLIRSAAHLAPDAARAAHYVRHNRCFAGSLTAGDAAPDVTLACLAGGASISLLDALPARGPTLLLAASFT